jgi:HPt (histidine-containing phosphotransfer) domain-containing protein
VSHWLRPHGEAPAAAAPAPVAAPDLPAAPPRAPAAAPAPAAPAKAAAPAAAKSAPPAPAKTPASARPPAAAKPQAPAPAARDPLAPLPPKPTAFPKRPAEPPRRGRVPVIEVGGDDDLDYQREADRAESLPALDLEHLEEMCMGVAALRDQLLDTFLAEIGPRLERLEESVSIGDAQEVVREAHGLRGMLGTIGARAAGELFAALETLGSSGDVSAAPRLLARAKVAAERTRQEIEALPFRKRAA